MAFEHVEGCVKIQRRYSFLSKLKIRLDKLEGLEVGGDDYMLTIFKHGAYFKG